MLFQTPEFLVLMVVVLAGLTLLRTTTTQQVLLVIASYVFYAWLDVRFLILLLISSSIDYSGALGIYGTKLSWRERWGLAAFTIASAWFCLGLNWPLLQSGGHAGAESAVNLSGGSWTWTAFLRPGIEQFPLAFGLCAAFALIWPLLYEWFFSFPEQRRRNAFLITSMSANLGMLAIFKYGNFALDNWVALGQWLGYEWNRPALDVALPPGISFYTFVTMSYGIDAYRREIIPERSFLRMALFVSYFPHLVAGPVIRPDQLLPTLKRPWELRSERIVSGFHLCLVGLFKKIMIADWLAKLVQVILNQPEELAQRPTLALWIGAACFAVQIYCDFSGYTDIARGVSRIMGVELPLNFDFPYFSRNISEFWRRWHISLSTWLRDYLYIPLGGGRVSPPRIYFNLMTTMVLGGLWHGASWNFVLWGAYHGLLLCLHRLWTGWTKGTAVAAALATRPGQILCWALTMYVTLLGWLIFFFSNPAVPFYNSSGDQAGTLLGVIARFVIWDGQWNLASTGLGRGAPITAALAMLLFIVFHASSYFYGRWAELFDRWPRGWRMVLYVGLGFLGYYFWPTENTAFIYFQF
ncbi:MAG: MBOAT family O-acyltransferase [Pirellulales bacterium]|nr:MBOAT family O-acyltransferase [Pirellulales bacterium]